jgi:hypothetical protein
MIRNKVPFRQLPRSHQKDRLQKGDPAVRRKVQPIVRIEEGC